MTFNLKYLIVFIFMMTVRILAAKLSEIHIHPFLCYFLLIALVVQLSNKNSSLMVAYEKIFTGDR